MCIFSMLQEVISTPHQCLYFRSTLVQFVCVCVSFNCVVRVCVDLLLKLKFYFCLVVNCKYIYYS